MAVQGLKSVQRELEKLSDDLDDAVNNAAESSINATERRAKRELVENDAIATTETFNSFVQTVVEKPSGGRRYTLGNESPKAKFVEWGTGQQFGTSRYPKLPSNRYEAPSFSSELVVNISEWIRTKPGFRGQSFRDRPQLVDAIPIALSIAGLLEGYPSGTPPQPFMRAAWFIEKPKLKLDVKYRVMRATRRF